MNQDYYPCVHRDGMWCKKFSVDGKLSYCSLRYEDPCPHQTLSNADRIRAMSDEELANVLVDHSNNGGWITETGRQICYERIIEWLQQPVKEGADQ